MVLYHGTNLAIDAIDLSKCRPYKDFGKGFYLTTLEDQAQKMAKRISMIHGGTPIVNVYEFDDSVLTGEHFSIRVFDVPSIEWVLFVTGNRSNSDINDNNLDNRYDIVIGPIADDDLSLLFRQFALGFINEDALMKGMKYKRLTDQYSFHTEKAIAFLKKERDYIVSP